MFANHLDPLTALSGGDGVEQRIDRVMRLSRVLGAWPQLQKAVKALRALDVLAVHEAGKSVDDLSHDLGVTRGSVYKLIKLARETPDLEANAVLPDPLDTLLAPLLGDPGTLDRALRLHHLLSEGALNEAKSYVAWVRSSDVLILHRKYGIKYEHLAERLGLTSDRTARIADMAKGTYNRTLPSDRRTVNPDAAPRARPGESAKAVETAMRALEEPFSMAEVTEASGYKPGQVQRVLKALKAEGVVRDAGPRPKGVAGRNVATYEFVEK
jgi:uncharacterized protein YjiS (DUF1127 family)